MRLPVDPELFSKVIPEKVFERKVRDNPENAPGWRFFGSTYSCIPDPELPWDPDLVEAIRENDPGFIPLTVYSLYLSSPDYASQFYVVVKRHAAGRFVPRPKAEKTPFYVRMPRDADFPVPNQIDDIFHEGPRDEGGPYVRGGFCPLDWSLYWSPLVELTQEELRQLHIDDPDAQAAAEQASLQEELFYAQQEINRVWDKALEKMSDKDIDDFLGRQRAGMPLFDQPQKSTFDLGHRSDRIHRPTSRRSH